MARIEGRYKERVVICYQERWCPGDHDLCSDFRMIGKIKADTAGLHLNAHAHSVPGLGRASNRVPVFYPKALHSHFQASFTHLSACVRKQCPPRFRRTLPLRPAPRGRPRPRAPGAPGQEPARTLPARPDPPRAFSEFLRAEPGPGWGAALRSLLGHRRQGGSKMRDALTAPNAPSLRGLLPRKPSL